MINMYEIQVEELVKYTALKEKYITVLDSIYKNYAKYIGAKKKYNTSLVVKVPDKDARFTIHIVVFKTKTSALTIQVTVENDFDSDGDYIVYWNTSYSDKSDLADDIKNQKELIEEAELAQS